MVALKFSSSTEQTLRRVFGDDLGRAALEALAIEAYRSAKLTAGEIATLLGLETSIQAQEWLGRHGIALNYAHDDLQDDRTALSGAASSPPVRKGSPDSVLRLAGTLNDDEAERILKAAQECRRIDPALWNGL